MYSTHVADTHCVGSVRLIMQTCSHVYLGEDVTTLTALSFVAGACANCLKIAQPGGIPYKASQTGAIIRGY